ncbi:vacuolar fusion protein MON1 homolog B isoform X2 [Microcaecilia unicolor]|nr:vacuolar fusion protein MON1 homolog B-like isoform X2 [Microcaecilia unicolor]XP_030049830.1 vacuolar fusion protein MON1 homolog B-like isoform X2 [Microcaecilia unicolor]XP_030049831.1 vacuolar fusion protein MON1 homolog B-like isoform X2 [Microcaecilia unicolor]XP_030049832.1 vacuolar fusion protein MON1 homolog B-like isoform X2 [Microcaecilia unicolor]
MEIESSDLQNQGEMGSSEEQLNSLSVGEGARGNLTNVEEKPQTSCSCGPQETNAGGTLESCSQDTQESKTEHSSVQTVTIEGGFCRGSHTLSPVSQKCKLETKADDDPQNNGIVVGDGEWTTAPLCSRPGEAQSEETLVSHNDEVMELKSGGTTVFQDNQLEDLERGPVSLNESEEEEVILVAHNCRSEETKVTGAPCPQISTPEEAEVTSAPCLQISAPEEAEVTSVPVSSNSGPKVADVDGILPQELVENLSETRDTSSDRDLSDSASTDNTLEDSSEFTQRPLVGHDSLNHEPSLVTALTHRDDDVTAEEWRAHRKHVFVLSEAGKPIYSRYGNEEALSSTMGVMMALVSFVQTGNNCIRSIYSEDRKVVFIQQGPLVLVSVSRTLQSEQQLRRELMYVYYQIISMLTQASISRIFERKKNYDLRRLLAGSEKILDSLLDLLERDPGFLLGAVQCLSLPASLRDSLSTILQKAITTNLVFSILVARSQLVTIVQEKAVIEDCRLDPADLHLLLNLIGASSAFQAGEIWTPICLPRFNPDGYFYAYISYLDPECTVCLILLSTDKESFYAVSGCKKRAEESMRTQGSLQALTDGLQRHSYSVAMVGVPDLWHFMYKPMDIPDNYRQLAQFTSPETEGPYAREEERQRLFDLYRYLHSRLHSTSRPLRLIYHMAEKETLLAWVTSKFELYTSFSPLVTKAGAISVVTKLLHWLKKEEDRLFIRYPPKYSNTPGPSKSAKAGRTSDRTDTSRGENSFFLGL